MKKAKKQRLIANVSQEVIDLVWEIRSRSRTTQSQAVEQLILEGAKQREQKPSVKPCKASATS